MRNHFCFRPSRLFDSFLGRPRVERDRSARRHMVIESLEARVYLSTAPRTIGDPTLFHTPVSDTDPETTVPRLLPVPVRDSIVPGTILDLGHGLVAFLTNERAQGRDLNRDGDKFDQVLHSFDADTGVLRNSRQAAVADSLIDLGDGLVAFLTDEADQGRRLNRDRDKLDLVLQVFDARTGQVRNSRQAVLPDSLVDVGRGRVAFLTPEADQGRILNDDGDKLDNVLQVFDFEDNAVRNSRQQAVIDSVIDIGSGFVAFVTDESKQGEVLNADGDKLDLVLQTFNVETGEVQNTGQAVG